MQKLLHIVFSILSIIVSSVKVLELISEKKEVLPFIIASFLILVIINLFIWGVNIIENMVINWYVKKQQKNYSLLIWMGDTRIPLTLYDKLSSIKPVKQVNFHENYFTIKQNIKAEFKNIEELKAFRTYLEIQTESPKYNALFQSTQTIMIAMITATVVTLVNFIEKSSNTILTYIIILGILWIVLLNMIDFMGKETDKRKLLLKLVNECVNEENNIIIV